MTRAAYRRWIVANAWSEGFGLGTTLFLGIMIGPHLEGLNSPSEMLGGALGAVLLGVLLEGVVVGWAQGRVLHAIFDGLPVRGWVVATVVGAGVAWLLGMIPSSIASILASDASTAVPQPEPSPIVQYALAAAMGLVLGPVLAVAQMRVLKRHLTRSWRWMPANALAWAAGMTIVFVGMDQVPWEGSTPAIAVTIYATCTVAGAVVGAVHGWLLLAMISSDAA